MTITATIIKLKCDQYFTHMLSLILIVTLQNGCFLGQFYRRGNTQELFIADKKQSWDLNTSGPDPKARMLGFIILPLCVRTHRVLIIKETVYYSIFCLFCLILCTL